MKSSISTLFPANALTAEQLKLILGGGIDQLSELGHTCEISCPDGGISKCTGTASCHTNSNEFYAEAVCYDVGDMTPNVAPCVVE